MGVSSSRIAMNLWRIETFLQKYQQSYTPLHKSPEICPEESLFPSIEVVNPPQHAQGAVSNEVPVSRTAPQPSKQAMGTRWPFNTRWIFFKDRPHVTFLKSRHVKSNMSTPTWSKQKDRKAWTTWLVGWLIGSLWKTHILLFHPHKTTYCWANWSLENRLVQMIRYPHRFLHFKHDAVILLQFYPIFFLPYLQYDIHPRNFFSVRPCKILMIGRWSFPEMGLSGCTSFTSIDRSKPLLWFMRDPNLHKKGRDSPKCTKCTPTNIARFSQDVKKTSGHFLDNWNQLSWSGTKILCCIRWLYWISS